MDSGDRLRVLRIDEESVPGYHRVVEYFDDRPAMTAAIFKSRPDAEVFIAAIRRQETTT